MTTSGVGCKRRSLSPSSLLRRCAASLPNSFGLVANQVADTAIVRRGGFLPLYPRSCSKPESSGSMLPQRSPSRPRDRSEAKILNCNNESTPYKIRDKIEFLPGGGETVFEGEYGREVGHLAGMTAAKEGEAEGA